LKLELYFRKEKKMNAYTENFLKENEVKEAIFKTKIECNLEANQLRKDGWKVTTKKYHFDGRGEQFLLTALRKKN